MKRAIGKGYQSNEESRNKYLKKSSKDYVIHYLVLSTDRRISNVMIIPVSQPNIPNTSETRRYPIQTRTTIHGTIPNMNFYFNRPVQNVKSLNLVWFELSLNVSKLVEGTGNENLYKQLLKGIDISVYPSYGDFVKQIHHPFASSHFHAEFKEVTIDKYQEHINLLSASRQATGGFTTRTTTEQTENESARMLKIQNQDTLYRNFQTYNTLNSMYDWLVERSGVNNYQRNANFNEQNFNELVLAGQYDRVSEFMSAELGGRYYTYSSQEVNRNGRIIIDVDASIEHVRTSERRSNIVTITGDNPTQAENRLTNAGFPRAVRIVDSIFYVYDYETFRDNNVDLQGDTTRGWGGDIRIGLGRYYYKPDRAAGENIVYERVNNETFNVTTYNRSHAGLRGGDTQFYNGRYYTREAENRILEFTPNSNTVNDETRAQINTFLIQNSKQFILNTQAQEYINYLIGYRDRTSENIAVPPLATAGLSTTTTTVTTTGTVTPTSTVAPVNTPDQEHILAYYNTSSFIQTAKTAGNNIIPKLDFIQIKLSFPSISREDQQKINNKLENSEVNAGYRIKFGACIEGYYRPGLSLEGVNR